MPDDFIKRQFDDENYKLENGESISEVKNRVVNAMKNILLEHNDKVVIIVHGIVLMTYLKSLCEVSFIDDAFKVVHNSNLIFNKILNEPPEIFKLTFDDINLFSIENIKNN